MKRCFFKTGVLLSLMTAACIIFGNFPAGAQQAGGERVAASKDDARFIVFYFHTTKRCGPCKLIEQWSEDAIKMNFQEELSAGKLEWRTVNVDKQENRHFVKDYNLYTKSVIIAKLIDGEVVDWKNLDKIWRLYRDEEKYFDYMASNMREFMEGS